MKVVNIVLLLLIIPYVILKTYDANDKNLEITNNIIAERAIEYGYPFVIKDINSINKDLIEFKRRSEDNIPTYKEIKEVLGKARNDNEKIQIYGAAIVSNIKFGKISRGKFYFSMCRYYVKKSNPIIVEDVVFEIVDKLTTLDIEEAQIIAVDLLFCMYYSQDQILRIYKLCGKEFSAKYMGELEKNAMFRKKHRDYLKYISKARIIYSIDKYSEEFILKHFLYSGIEFSMRWNVKKWRNYRYPIIAYLYYCGGNMKMYKKYKQMSISGAQLYDMRGCYYQYIEYASKVFCLTNDSETSILLLKKLPHGHKRNLVLKRVIGYLTGNKSSFLNTLQSDLLR